MTENRKTLGSVFFVFSGYVLSVTAFLFGGAVGNQLNFTEGCMALLIGNMFLAVYAAILGMISRKADKSSAELYKAVFGVKGQILATSVVSLFVLTFISVYSSLFGSMLASLFPGVSPYVGLVLFLVILAVINLVGFKGMSFFSKLGVPAISLFVVYGLIMINKQLDFANIIVATPVNPAPFVSVVSGVAASWMVGGTLSADIVRFVKKPSHVWIVTIASFLCVAILESVGMLCVLGTGESDIVKILSQLNMAVVAFFIYALLTITSGHPSVFIVSTALVHIINVFRTPTGEVSDGKYTAEKFVIPVCVAAGAVGVFMTATGFMPFFSAMMGIIGSALPPVGGALVAQFFFIDRNFSVDFTKLPLFKKEGFIAWFVGICVSRFFNFGIHALNGFVAAIIVYVIICKLFNGSVSPQKR